jgi:hypothetical protein
MLTENCLFLKVQLFRKKLFYILRGMIKILIMPLKKTIIKMTMAGFKTWVFLLLRHFFLKNVSEYTWLKVWTLSYLLQFFFKTKMYLDILKEVDNQLE